MRTGRPDHGASWGERCRTLAGIHVAGVAPAIAAAILGLLAGAAVVAGPKATVVTLGAAAVIAGTLRFPATALGSIVALIVIEGAIRKWVVPGLADAVYFAKDALLAVLIARVTVVGARIGLPPPRELPAAVTALFVANGLWFGLEILNSENPSLALYVLGWRAYALPLALLVVVPAVWTAGQSRAALRALVLALVPIAALALLQTLLPATHPINRYVAGDAIAATMGEGKRTAVRATATFSYISGLASFALAMTLLAPWALDLRTRRGLVLGTATIAAGLAALVASGSRGPLFAALVGLPVATWPLWRHNLGRAARGLAIAGGLAALLSLLFADTFGAFAERTRNSKDLGDRATWPIRHILKAAPQAGLMGSGPGTAHQSRSALLALTGESGRLPPQWDSEIANVFFELGAVGGALWYALRLALLAMLVLWVRDQRTPMRAEDRLGAFGLVALSLYTLATGMVFNHTLYYLWAFCVATLRQVSADEPA